MYLYNVYASIRKFTIFAVVSIISVIGQCFFYWLFCTQFDSFGLLGIPIADFIFYAGICIVLLIILKSKIGSFDVGKIIWSAIRVLLASTVGCFVGVVLMNYIDLGSTSMLNGIFQLVVCGTISLIVVALFCWLFRVKEILQLFDAIKNKFKRN